MVMTKPTRKDAEEMIGRALRNETAWKAASILFERLRADPSYATLDVALRESIERFLAQHPAP